MLGAESDATATLIPATWAATACAISAAAGWLIKAIRDNEEYRKLRAEAAKLTEETIKLTGDTLVRVQDSRDKFRDACKVSTERAGVLRSLLLQPPDRDAIDKAREALCSALLDDTIPRFVSFVEWERKRYTNFPAQLCELAEDTLTELRRFADWLSYINQPHLRNWLGRNPAVLKQSTLRPFSHQFAELPPDKKEALERLLGVEVIRLTVVEDDGSESKQ